MTRPIYKGFRDRASMRIARELEAFAAKLQQATEVFAVWPRGRIETLTPEQYTARGTPPVGVLVFLSRAEAEACAEKRIAALATKGK